MDLPVVSVVIPTFNCARYLPLALDSVLSQDYENIEIILVDDGSTDDTVQVIQPFMERIQYVKQENWGGPSRPRNVGVQKATGEYIAFFDSDDLMIQGKLAESVRVMEKHPDISLVFTNFRGIDQEGKIVRSDYLKPYSEFRKDLEFRESGYLGILAGSKAYGHLLMANFIGTSSVVCRKAVFSEVGPFDESMLNSDDVDMWRRLACAGIDFAFIDREFHEYRKNPQGVTSRGGRRYPHLLKGLRKHQEMNLDPALKEKLERKIYDIELGYGYALFQGGDFKKSKEVFEKAIAAGGFSWPAVKGLLKAKVFLLVNPGTK